MVEKSLPPVGSVVPRTSVTGFDYMRNNKKEFLMNGERKMLPLI